MILMKDTALVSVIGLEIMRRSQIAVTASKEPFTFFLVAAFIPQCLTIVAMIGMHFLENVPAAASCGRSMTWEIFIKWLPSFIDGAWLTLQLVGVSVITGLILAVPLGIAVLPGT